MLFLFLGQKGFSNNIPNTVSKTNDKLIEKLAKSDEIAKLQRLSFGIGILKLKANEEYKIEGKLSNELKSTYTKFADKSVELYTRIVDKNPELKKLNHKERTEIIKQAAQKELINVREVLGCLFSLQDVWDCVSDFTSRITRGVFITCMIASRVTDIYLLVESLGTATEALIQAFPAEVSFCGKISGAVGIVQCFIDVAFDIANCVLEIE